MRTSFLTASFVITKTVEAEPESVSAAYIVDVSAPKLSVMANKPRTACNICYSLKRTLASAHRKAEPRSETWLQCHPLSAQVLELRKRARLHSTLVVVRVLWCCHQDELRHLTMARSAQWVAGIHETAVSLNQYYRSFQAEMMCAPGSLDSTSR